MGESHGSSHGDMFLSADIRLKYLIELLCCVDEGYGAIRGTAGRNDLLNRRCPPAH